MNATANVQFLDVWTCPECRTVMQRGRMTGRVWIAAVEDHFDDCKRSSPLRLEQTVGQGRDSEDRLFVLSRLSRVSECTRLAREVMVQQGIESFTLETVLVRAMSGLMEIEQKMLEARSRSRSQDGES